MGTRIVLRFKSIFTDLAFIAVMAQALNTHPDDWIEKVFSAKAVMRGGVIRRSVFWVQREIGVPRFIDEVRGRGFHLLEGGGQFIVICNPAPIRRVV